MLWFFSVCHTTVEKDESLHTYGIFCSFVCKINEETAGSLSTDKYNNFAVVCRVCCVQKANKKFLYAVREKEVFAPITHTLFRFSFYEKTKEDNFSKLYPRKRELFFNIRILFSKG